ncbi:hypothetical protein SOPP22_06425 [Shewanella sp. OPT22]|nr:hypothetical protein SOPP22_06425 [Shewanella sp. OPT22]
MFTPLFLSVALASATPTKWQYEHQVSSFTNEQTISLVGKNPDNSEFSLLCKNNQFQISIYIPEAESLQNTIFGKVDNQLGVKLVLESLGNKVIAYRKGVWGNWAKMISEMKKGSKVTFLLQDDGSPTIVEFDLSTNNRNIETIVEHCGNF